MFSNNNHPFGSENGRQLSANRQFPYNADDEICRTIKAQYQQSSIANFRRQDSFGATGVACERSQDSHVEREREREREQRKADNGECRGLCEESDEDNRYLPYAEYELNIRGRLSRVYCGVRLHQTISYFKGLMPFLSRTITTQADSALVEIEVYKDE